MIKCENACHYLIVYDTASSDICPSGQTCRDYRVLEFVSDSLSMSLNDFARSKIATN